MSADGRPPRTPVALGDPPQPQFSPYRVSVMLVVLLCAAAACWYFVVGPASDATAKTRSTPVYAPYVDVTLTPTYPFQSASAAPVAHVYLGFVVSSPTAVCTPSWGGYYTLDAASREISLDSRVAEVRSQGGSVYVSFGGERNSEMAVGCTDLRKLTSAYQQVITRYQADTVDFDIEGAALTDYGADVRRARAIRAIQKHDPKLKVWITLPVARSGLTNDDITAIKAMLRAHVNLAGVNAMAMDFGTGQGAATDMLGTVEAALDATHAQIQAIWKQAKLDDGSAVAWQHLGVTTMIGVNDVTDEHFTVDDARQLRGYVAKRGIARVSIWSLNRDSQCGGAFTETGTLSNTCSGVEQQSLQFTKIFSKLAGTETAKAQTTTTPLTISPDGSGKVTAATSPYPVWRSTADYVAGYKVVFDGSIYQSRWYSVGTPPDAESDGSDNPWLLIGPVPAHSAAYKPTIAASGHGELGVWSVTTVYRRGDKVDFDGLPYEARYYTKGDQPNDQLPADPSSPWTPLFTAPHEPADNGSDS